MKWHLPARGRFGFRAAPTRSENNDSSGHDPYRVNRHRRFDFFAAFGISNCKRRAERIPLRFCFATDERHGANGQRP
jgi:hypothetical protein